MSPDPIVILEGRDRVTVTVTAVDETYPDPDDVFTLSLMSESSLVMIGDRSSIMVTIIDDDAVRIGFDSASYSVNEDADSVVLTVKSLNGLLTEHFNRLGTTTVHLTYETMDGTATAEEDYTRKATRITLTRSNTEVTIMVPIIDDSRPETDETFTVVLCCGHSGAILNQAIATVTIIDNDQAPPPSMRSVSFAATSSTSDEGGSANVVVELDGDPHQSDVVVSFTVGGTAVAGTDYTSPGSSVTIPAGMRSATITFNIDADQRYEGADETVVLTLTSATGGVTVDATKDDHTVTITDNETAPTVVFNTDSSTSDEGTTATVEVRLDGDLHESDVVVSFTVGGTAVAGTDYTSPGNSVTIPAGMRSAMITFNIDTDQRYERADETVVLTLTSATGDVTVGTPSVHTVMITDNETAPTVIFDTGSSTSDEGTTATVEVRLDGDLHESDVVVSFTVGGTAVAGTDYTSPGNSVTIPAGMRSAMITFAITSDNLYDGATETVVLTLTTATGDVTVGTPSVHTVAITDNDDPDAVVIGFDPVPYSVDENDGSVVLTVKLLSGTLTETVVVNYETMGGSAIAGKDYMRKSGMLTWSPGTTEMTITVSIIDDSLLEDDEMFTVVLSGTPAGVTLTPDTAEVTITDTSIPDVVEIGFDPDTYTVDEGAGTIELTVKVLRGALGRTVTLSYETRDGTGTATAGEDYTSKATTLTLSAGETETTVMVDIIDDSLLEEDEMFTVVLSGAPAGVTLTPDTAEVTITDTNAPDVVEIGFDPDTYTVDEGAGTIALTVKVLRGALGRAVTLSYETRDGTGTATAGEDYTSKATTLTLSAGETETTVMVDIIDDSLLEEDEMFTVVLSGAPAGVTLTVHGWHCGY